MRAASVVVAGEDAGEAARGAAGGLTWTGSSSRGVVSTASSTVSGTPVSACVASVSSPRKLERIRSTATELGTPSSRASSVRERTCTPWNHVFQIGSASWRRTAVATRDHSSSAASSSTTASPRLSTGASTRVENDRSAAVLAGSAACGGPAPSGKSADARPFRSGGSGDPSIGLWMPPRAQWGAPRALLPLAEASPRRKGRGALDPARAPPRRDGGEGLPPGPAES